VSRRYLRSLGLCVVWTAFAGPSAAGWPYYTAASIDATVVDAKTGEPVRGANVIANWQLVEDSLHGERTVGQLEVMEAVTDDKGRFHFDGFTKANPTLADLGNRDPQILIFKRDYVTKVIMNHYGMTSPLVIGANRKSQVDGTNIRLEPRTMEESGDMSYLGTTSALYSLIQDCEWKKIPRAIVAMTQETERIRALDRARLVGLPTIGTIDGSPAKCGSAVDFFRGQRP
jgi:hypothetical protein